MNKKICSECPNFSTLQLTTPFTSTFFCTSCAFQTCTLPPLSPNPYPFPLNNPGGPRVEMRKGLSEKKRKKEKEEK
jgi:hypothetical protein